MKKINMNVNVFVILTEKGREEFIEYEKKRHRITEFIFPNLTLTPKNLDGKLCFQLWELFSIFGSNLMNGSAAVFVDNCIEIK